MGLFDEPLQLVERARRLEDRLLRVLRDRRRRDFVRGAKWSLAPTGGPINARCRRAPARPRGAPTTTCTCAEYLGRGVSWGIFGEDLPDEATASRWTPS